MIDQYYTFRTSEMIPEWADWTRCSPSPSPQCVRSTGWVVGGGCLEQPQTG